LQQDHVRGQEWGWTERVKLKQYYADETIMRSFVRNHTEILIVLSLFAIFGLLKIVMANEIALLNLYFIPVLLSGYFLGKKRAILSAVASVLLAVLFMIRWPDELFGANPELYAGLNILVWAALLVLSSILVSTLNESRHHRQATATLQLLEKYIKDKGEQENHATRVGRLAREIARELKLHPRLLASVEAAGLLHDIADTEAGMDLINECHALKCGASNPIIGEAIPILSRMHQRPGQSVTSIGPNILIIADLYDTALSADRNRDLLQMVQYLESETDESSTIVIRALTRVINSRVA